MDLVGDFLRHLRHNVNASSQTVRCYRTDLVEFEEFLGRGLLPRRGVTLTSLDHHAVREYLSFLYERGVSRATVARKLASLRSFFRHLVRQGLAVSNPAAMVSTPTAAALEAPRENAGRGTESVDLRDQNARDLQARFRERCDVRRAHAGPVPRHPDAHAPGEELVARRVVDEAC